MATLSRGHEDSDNLEERPSKRPRVEGEGETKRREDSRLGEDNARAEDDEDEAEDAATAREHIEPSRASDLYLDTVRLLRLVFG